MINRVSTQRTKLIELLLTAYPVSENDLNHRRQSEGDGCELVDGTENLTAEQRKRFAPSVGLYHNGSLRFARKIAELILRLLSRQEA